MASAQKRWLSAPKGKLSKADLPSILGKEGAWSILPQETRQQLYDLLPPPRAGDPPHNVDVHPMDSPYRQFIEQALKRWQDDLVDGKEQKSWREQAMQAEEDRKEGKWEVWKAWQREQDWGLVEDKDEAKGDGTKMEDVKSTKESLPETKPESKAEEVSLVTNAEPIAENAVPEAKVEEQKADAQSKNEEMRVDGPKSEHTDGVKSDEVAVEGETTEEKDEK